MLETRKLKDWPVKILDGDRSKRYPKRNEMVNSGVLFLSTPSLVDGRINVETSNYITEDKFSEIKKGRLVDNDIVMTTRGTIGKLAFFKATPKHKTGLINAQMLILRADQEVIEPRFLFYLMGSDRYQREMKNFTSGSAQPQIPITDLKETELTIPEIKDQKAIVDVIDTYSNLIENNNRRIAILEDMAQSLYREWFVKFRFPGHENVKFKDSPLGQIPEGWEVKTFKELVNYKTGKLNSNAAVEGGDYPFFTCSQETFRTNTWSFDCECVLLGGNNANAIYPIKYFEGKFDAYQRTYVITEKDREQITPAYLYFSLLLKLTHLKNISTGAATRFLTKGILDNLEFIVPPANLMSDFNDLGLSALKLKNSLVKKNESIKKQRDALLPKLISGTISV